MWVLELMLEAFRQSPGRLGLCEVVSEGKSLFRHVQDLFFYSSKLSIASPKDRGCLAHIGTIRSTGNLLFCPHQDSPPIDGICFLLHCCKWDYTRILGQHIVLHQPNPNPSKQDHQGDQKKPFPIHNHTSVFQRMWAAKGYGGFLTQLLQLIFQHPELIFLHAMLGLAQ